MFPSKLKLIHRPRDDIQEFVPPRRPKFHHQNTSDRLRESFERASSFPMTGRIRKDRKSVFQELGLDEQQQTLAGDGGSGELSSTGNERPAQQDERRRGEGGESTQSARSRERSSSTRWYSRLTPMRRPKAGAADAPSGMPGLSRVSTAALLVAVVVPGFSYYNGREKVVLSGADAGPIGNRPEAYGPHLEARASSPTQVCTRWSQQTAELNGTLYIYGGQATTTAGQDTNTWNNNFLTLDVSSSWDISSPSLTGLPQPSGPPAVANGILWNDYDNLYLYGGEFADNPYVEPAPVATWQYSISSQTWIEYSNPQTLAGNNTDPGGAAVQRAAEGAGISVPELGLSWYFGGHLDLSTTPGWSNQVARVYLKSLLEFTNPGYSNNGIQALTSAGAPAGGAYRNITQGGLQVTNAFYERADGVLVFVPGWGEKGVLIGLAGGTNDTFANDLSTLDVYDIASSVWYQQQTSGPAPGVRVNPCAVVASAPDASSFQIYLYGGQNLIPYDEQIQYSDMYILTIPSFTWVNFTQAGTMPPARAGHTCNLRDGQMVVVGGYVGTSISCDSPGIYVFNASSLAWTSGFTALSHPEDLDPGNSVLAASYGYTVPEVVVSVIGGDPSGTATVTAPASSATGGPFATGKPPVFTVTDAGNTATVTAWSPGSTGGSSSSSGGGGGSSVTGSSSDDNRDPGLIAAGVIAGLAGLLAIYLGYCAWIYRRQVRAYKAHLAVANRYGVRTASATSGLAAWFGGSGRKASGKAPKGVGYWGAKASQNEKRGRTHKRDTSTSTTDSSAWALPTEPRHLFDMDHQTTPGGKSSYSSSRPSGQAADVPPHGAGASIVGGAGVGSSTPGRNSGQGSTAAGEDKVPRRSGSQGSSGSVEGLLPGQEPSFFSVVLGPRRALRVVNGLEGEGEAEGQGNR